MTCSRVRMLWISQSSSLTGITGLPTDLAWVISAKHQCDWMEASLHRTIMAWQVRSSR